MYLLDTNVISELRKKQRANAGVLHFFRLLAEQQAQAYLSVITLGELRRGAELIRHNFPLINNNLLFYKETLNLQKNNIRLRFNIFFISAIF
jgi:toxin FitB